MPERSALRLAAARRDSPRPPARRRAARLPAPSGSPPRGPGASRAGPYSTRYLTREIASLEMIRRWIWLVPS